MQSVVGVMRYVDGSALCFYPTSPAPPAVVPAPSTSSLTDDDIRVEMGLTRDGSTNPHHIIRGGVQQRTIGRSYKAKRLHGPVT